MDQPHNIFAFESALTLHIFVAPGEFETVEFADFVDKASLECVPERVAVYYPANVIGAAQLKLLK